MNTNFLKSETILKATAYFTSRVPVDVCDVARSTFADADPFACEHVVNVHKVVVGGHGQVLPCVCAGEGAVTVKSI